jgi:signal transduction histidine kinase
MSRTVLLTCAFLIPLAILWELVVNPTPESMVQAGIDLLIGLLVLYEIRHDARIHVFTLTIAVTYVFLSLWDSTNGTSISRFDVGMTLALLVLISVIHIGTRPASNRSTYFLSALIAAWAIATVAIVDMSSTQEVGLLLLAIPGQILVIWLITQIIRDLSRTSEVEAKHARIQTAIAGCSQALLKRGGEQPLTEALQALLGATDADYAYVDVNRTHPQGHTTWEIVAEAEGGNFPNRDGSWISGDYAGLPEAEAALQAGDPAIVITSELEGEVRRSYELEGIKAELIAPIRISDRWIGTIGYADYTRDGGWTDIEVEGLMRAAEMVSAYWEREAAREGLMELATAKDRFIASVSHELRTPLSAVVGFAGELKRGKGDFSRAEIEEIATLIYAQSMEVSQLVDDLLTAERATSGNLTINATDISLLDECADVIEFTRGDREVEITGDDVIARADALRTRQILRNLFTNALRYGGETIELSVSSRGDQAVVRVSDNGAGVRTGDIERIFDPYYRVEGETTKPDSVGLGLAVARQLARLMDGDVVYQRSRGWTVFEFTLPLIPADLDEDELPAGSLLPVS